MTELQRLSFAQELTDNMRDNILPYWLNRMVDPAGGFYARRDGYNELDTNAPKGAILNARILWTFAAAYNESGTPDYLDAARRAYGYIRNHFIDRDHGGVFWSLNPDGTPLDTKKQYYAIAFTIYGLAEYYRATGENEAMQEAMELFRSIETHSRDRGRGGYLEAATRDWQPIADMRLSEKDSNASKTMNTHLHIIEGYTALLRISNSEEVAEAVQNLLRIFLDRIYQPATGHLGLFFDDNWNLEDNTFSYGHDIEASWLLLESARVLGDEELIAETMKVTRILGERALDGLQPDGSLIYERHADGTPDTDRHWWVQAECIVGQMYLALFHGLPQYYGKAMRTWQYCRENLVDNDGGEWYWSRHDDGSVNRTEDKAGFWKCPYHNSRACMEAARILKI